MTVVRTSHAGRTWLDELEKLRNDSPNHVPIGLHLDLFDNMPDANNACDREGGSCGPTADNVAGFTNEQLCAGLAENTTDFLLREHSKPLPR